MKIAQILPVKFNSGNHSKTQQKYQENLNMDYAYNPISYKDYNVSFEAKRIYDQRKHWTPEQFYDLPSNKNNMPDTMREYLNADYSKRYHQSPIRILSESFEKIEDAKNLDEVKTMFNNEKLFENLTSKPNKIARTGVLAEHRVFGDMGALFADGSDDLGMYLIKKIYLEGKQLPEINKDFQKDISAVYKGALSGIKDDDIYAYGIKRPNFSFWNSLTHNRDDFPYEYRPRTLGERVLNNSSTKEKIHVPHSQYKKHQLVSISDYMLDIWKEITPQQQDKRLKRLKLGDEGESFFRQFNGPIGTVAADKVNLAQKLSEFMTNGFIPDNLKGIFEQLEKEDAVLLDFENPNDKIKAIMRTFWKQNSELKIQLGDAIRETTQEFEKAYAKGVDSPEFLNLLKQADELKEQKAIRMSEYSKMRYEKQKLLKANQPKVEPTLPKVPSVDVKPKTEPVLTIKDIFRKNFFAKGELLPDSFLNVYYGLLERSPLMTEDIMKASIDGFDDASIEVYNQVNEQISKTNKSKIQSAHQAMLDFISTTHLKDNVHNLYELDIIELSEVVKKSGFNSTNENKQLINKLYAEYLKPINNPKEIDSVAKKMIEIIGKYHIGSIHSQASGGLVALLAENLRDNQGYKVGLEKMLKKTHFIENYGSSSKVILKEGLGVKDVLAKFENMMVHFLLDNAQNTQLGKMLTANPDNAKSLLAFRYPECYEIVKNIEHYLKRLK